MITDEQIIEMAKQVRAHFYTDNLMSIPIQYRKCVDMEVHQLITFARLIAEKQKEIDAWICEEKHHGWFVNSSPMECAAAIRSQK